MTVLGDYICESYLDEKASRIISNIFNTHSVPTKEAEQVLTEILEMKLTSKIKITRNKVKALKLKKKLSKDFYILK